MIHIRKSIPADIDGIMACYATARQYMRATGNPHQWVNGYPSRELVADDIARGVGYVGVDDGGHIAMAFAFILGDDPTYAHIEDGQWPDNRPYGTIHRLGSSGKHRGMLRQCVDFCMASTDSLRLDTHADNATMQHAAESLGFRRCGIIYCQDGTPRIAYQKST
ncbi:MAG: GNAT family N-acetyltransferase [Muribaculaceae bacterium]|nr:GNAT family N-acetyltransferase [Muribaculaceae bacterium]